MLSGTFDDVAVHGDPRPRGHDDDMARGRRPDEEGGQHHRGRDRERHDRGTHSSRPSASRLRGQEGSEVGCERGQRRRIEREGTRCDGAELAVMDRQTFDEPAELVDVLLQRRGVGPMPTDEDHRVTIAEHVAVPDRAMGDARAVGPMQHVGHARQRVDDDRQWRRGEGKGWSDGDDERPGVDHQG